MYFACMYVSVSHGCLLLQLEGCLCVLKGYGSVNLVLNHGLGAPSHPLAVCLFTCLGTESCFEL